MLTTYYQFEPKCLRLNIGVTCAKKMSVGSEEMTLVGIQKDDLMGPSPPCQ